MPTTQPQQPARAESTVEAVPTVPALVCAWCHAVIRAGMGDPKRVSHGICQPCKARVLRDAGLDKKKEPIK